MSTSTKAGRGRGWLNLAKNDPPKPSGLDQFSPVLDDYSPSQAQTPILEIKNEHKELVNRINELNESDELFRVKHKMRAIENFFHNDCHSQEDVRDSVTSIYNISLRDRNFFSKCIILLSFCCKSATPTTFHGLTIRDIFLRLMQKDFESSSEMHNVDPELFRNFVYLIGEFYRKVKASNDVPYGFICAPYFSSLNILLRSKLILDLKVLAIELFKTRSSNLKSTTSSLPDLIAQLSIKAHIAFLETDLSREVKLWLLLILDIINSSSGVLSPELLKFYEEQLGTNVMINFMPTRNALSISTIQPSSKILDSYQSDVNVLQLTTSPTESPLQNDTQSQLQITSNEFNNSFSSNENNVHNNFKKEKPGRPILGAGASRYNKNKSKNREENNERNNKQNLSERSQKRGGPPALKNNRGWEHDDRFENDYD